MPSYPRRMPRFTTDQLVAMALTALEEAVRHCRSEPLRPTKTLRFALAFLGNDIADKQPFTDFWKAVTSKDEDINPTMRDALRSSTADGALHRIYVALGLERPKH